MQPQQPQPNYDFILNPSPAPKRTLLPGGNSMASRILLVVGGLFILVIIAAVFMSALGKSGGSFNKSAMLTVAQDQSEISRVAALGAQNGVSQRVKNFSVTAQLSLKSDQQNLLTYLATKKYKLKDKQLALKQNPQTDVALQAATSNSTYDLTYTGIMKQLLQTYQNDLKTAYNSGSQSAKAVLTTDYNNANLLSLQLASN